jgi:hypothetical protein
MGCGSRCNFHLVTDGLAVANNRSAVLFETQDTWRVSKHTYTNISSAVRKWDGKENLSNIWEINVPPVWNWIAEGRDDHLVDGHLVLVARQRKDAHMLLTAY